MNKFVLPLVRRAYPPLIAQNLVSVQPLNAPSTLVFYNNMMQSFHSRVQSEAYFLWEKAGKPNGQCFWRQALLKLVPSVQWAIEEELCDIMTCRPSGNVLYDFEFLIHDDPIAFAKIGSDRNESTYSVRDTSGDVYDVKRHPGPRNHLFDKEFDLASPQEYSDLINYLKNLAFKFNQTKEDV